MSPFEPVIKKVPQGVPEMSPSQDRWTEKQKIPLVTANTVLVNCRGNYGRCTYSGSISPHLKILKYLMTILMNVLRIYVIINGPNKHL